MDSILDSADADKILGRSAFPGLVRQSKTQALRIIARRTPIRKCKARIQQHGESPYLVWDSERRIEAGRVVFTEAGKQGKPKTFKKMTNKAW